AYGWRPSANAAVELDGDAAEPVLPHGDGDRRERRQRPGPGSLDDVAALSQVHAVAAVAARGEALQEGVAPPAKDLERRLVRAVVAARVGRQANRARTGGPDSHDAGDPRVDVVAGRMGRQQD